MATRAEIVARILRAVEATTMLDHAVIDTRRPLIGQEYIDSLDLMEIETELVDALRTDLNLTPDATVDSIADAVIAARGSRT